MLAIVTFILGAQAVFAATTPFTNALKRQTLIPTDGCVSACTPLENATSAFTLAELCTSAVVNDYAQCYDCLVLVGVETQTSAQEVVDAYVANCKAGGVPVNGATVSGSSGGSSGTSTTQRGAASGTASAGSSTSTSTTTTTGSSSGGSSSGSSSDSSGGSSSSSSGNSGSSSGDADSDDGDSGGSSGSGLGSGSGFKSNSGMQLSAAYLVVSMSFAFSAVLLQS
ncbi:hypothetical protein DFH08DRAFT_1085286 [Mycena albidolilacea]|uniref:Uncharacterized protein n=1 Tax=Mycena albidolilacea TaxID=1033008 RepID=A0AAD6ZIM6_9AGAR|nr:hypothetical protein DFH08DRAFT_1085286 [Mycena albidolilacea]